MKGKLLLLSGILVTVIVLSCPEFSVTNGASVSTWSDSATLLNPQQRPLQRDSPPSAPASTKLSVLNGMNTAFYGMADNESIRNLVGYADYVIVAHALYNDGDPVKDNVRYLATSGVRVILDTAWWDVWPFDGVVNRYSQLHVEDLAWGMNGTETVKYRIRNCIETIGSEYIWGVTIDEEVGDPNVEGFPWPLIAWYQNLFSDWMHMEYPSIQVLAWPAPPCPDFVSNYMYHIRADGIVYDNYDQNITLVGEIASLLRSAYPEGPIVYIVSAAESISGWSTCHPPTYLKRAVAEVSKYVDVVGFWTMTEKGHWGWEDEQDAGYQLSLRICDQIHLNDWQTVYGNTEWFECGFGNDTVTESLSNWNSAFWYEVAPDPSLEIQLSTDRQVGAYSINLTCVDSGTHSFWWQFGPGHNHGYPDWPDTGPYGAYNLSAASRISFWLKGSGWSSHPEATVRIFLEKSNYPAPSGEVGNLTLPEMIPYLLDGAWHLVTITLPLDPSAYQEWDGYASQIRVEVDYDHSILSDATNILLDGWLVDSFDTGKAVGLNDQWDFVAVDNGALDVGGSAYFESSFPQTDSWYYQYSGDGAIMMCINGTWTAPPDEGMPCYWNVTGVRLFNGSFDWIKINALPPLVEILSPNDEALVSGIVCVQVNAIDASGIKRVEFSVDGTLLYTDFSQPYSWDWDTTGHPDGTHRVNVTAYANSSAVNFYHIQVSVDNTKPLLTITAPLDGSLVSDTVQVSASASDSSGIVQVDFYVDGALLAADTSAPFGCSWNTLAQADGMRNLTCIAIDGAGNTNRVARLTVVDNSAPLIGIHSVSVWAQSGLVAVNTSDPSGIDRVEFYLDDVLQYTDYAYPYEWLWSGLSLPDGSHTVSVRSYDVLGHWSSASSGLEIDNTLPSLSVSWAPSGTVLRGVVVFSATATDANGIACVEFRLDGGLQYTDYSAPYEWSWDTTLVLDGMHSLTIIAIDSRGNSKQITMDLDVDNTEPSVFVNSPANQTVLSGPCAVTVIVTVQDATGIGIVLLSYYTGSAWTTVAMVPSGSYFEATTPVLPYYTLVLFRVSANDTLGNSVWSLTYACTVIDLTSPSVGVEVIPSTEVVAGIVRIDATASDPSSISMVILYVDGLPIAWLSSAPYSWDWDTSAWADGPHVLMAWANDTWGNSNYLETSIQTDNTGPQVVINTPVNLSVFEGPCTITVFATALDPAGIDFVSLSYYTGLAWIDISMVPSGNRFEGTIVGLLPGETIQARVFANDTLGNGAWSVTHTYHVVDRTPPSLLVMLAPEGAVHSGAVHIGVTATDISGISMVVLYVDGTPIAVLEDAPFEYLLDTGILLDGVHTLRVWANDTWGNSNYLETSIQTDNTGPSMSVSTPVNGTVYDAPARVSVEVSVGDPRGLSHVLVSYTTGTDWTTEVMVLYGSKYIWNSSLFSSGTIVRFSVFANDTLGNEVASELYECTVIDLSGPAIGAPSLLPKVPTSFDTVIVSISVSDHSGVDAVLLCYSVDVGPWVNVTMTLNLVYWVGIPAMATGSVISYRVYANDTLGQWASTPIYEYTVVPFDVLPPDVVSASWSPTIPDDSQTVEVTVNAADPSGVTMVVLAYHNGTHWHNVTMVLSDGRYVAEVPSQNYGTAVTLKVYACDGQGNWGVTPLGSYTVVSGDLDGPEVQLLTWSPSDPTEEDTVEVYAELSDVNQIHSVILCYGQGALLANVSMTFNGTGYVATIGARPIGAQVRLCIYSCDNRDNWAVGEWVMYVIQSSDITPPAISSILWSPFEPFSNESMDIRATVTDENEISLVLLGYFDGFIWRNMTMVAVPSESARYTARIPAVGTATTIQIRILAQDSKNNWGCSGFMEIEVQQVPGTTTPPSSTIQPPDTLVIGATGAIVLGLPAGIVVGLILSRLPRRNRSGK